MAESADELLTVLYNMVQDSFTMPFVGGKCLLDRDRVIELIEEINNALPTDIAQARKIVNDKNEILGAARREAEAIKRQAEERARQLVSQEEVLIIARQKAAEMVQAAEAKSRELRIATNQYVDDALRRTEEALNEALGEVRQSRSKFKNASGK